MPDAARALMTIFAKALEWTDPAARAAYLDRACGDDAALRRRVEALLAAHDGAGRFLEGDPTETSEPTSREIQGANRASDAETILPSELATRDYRPDSTFAETPQAHRPRGFVGGQVIASRYTLLEVLGEGGMGTVYRAGQTEPVKRQVALKLIMIGMDSRAVLARFDAERQALALMDHPSIARVYDGGTTEAGQPFFVMELVSGEPITDYCDRNRLSVRARLELFIAVCQAVQHAHQKGIIHRDLKPGNVLVTEVDGRPTPKVIDFGVAKATDVKLTDQSLADTGAIVGTPTYMSPEQAHPSSMDIDTRTDIYALGVILYELLTGSPPIDAQQFKRGAILEMLRMVREVDPPRPSTKVSTADALPSIAASRDIEPAQLKRALQGDLDWIGMMALEKDRARRYETANGFAADILRHLGHEPVVAAPPSRVYRVRKFVRKHRGAVIAASLVLLSLLGGLAAVAAVQTVANARLADSHVRETNANTALNEANGQLTKSHAAVQARYDLAVDAIKTFHTGVSEDFLLKEEKFKDLRNRLLKSASNFYGKLGALLSRETDLTSRRALWQANFELAELTDKVGRKEDALATHRQVLAAREALAADPGADVEAKVDVGRSLSAVAMHLFWAAGMGDEAVSTYRKAEALLAGLPRSSPTTLAALSKCRLDMADKLDRTGKTDDALALCRLARADLEALVAAPGASNEARQTLASTYYKLSDLLSQTGKPTEAEAELRRAITLRQKLVDDNPAVMTFRNTLAGILGVLAGQLSKTGRPAEAEIEYRKAIAILQKLVADNPAVIVFRTNLANNLGNFSLLLFGTGRAAEAEMENRRALALFQKLADDNPTDTELHAYLSESHMNLGVTLFETGRPAEAEAEYRMAISMFQKLVEEDPTVIGVRHLLAITHVNLAHLLLSTGKPSEAEPHYHAGIANLRKLVADAPKVSDHRGDLAWALSNFGGLLRKLGRPAEALERNDEAIALIEQSIKENPKNLESPNNLVRSLTGRELARRALGDAAGAAADIRRAQSLSEGLPALGGVGPFNGACAHAALAGLAGQDGAGVSAAEGRAEADQAMALLRKAVDAGHRDPTEFRAADALDPLRGREDFKKLVAELEKPSPAKPDK
jgi:eukaryotic-like serine/threonine-protein kinase